MYYSAPCNAYYKPSLKITRGKAELSFAVKENSFHAGGGVHGSVYFKALDDAAFFSANSLVKDVFILTTSFNLYFFRPVASGNLRAVGAVVNFGKNLIIGE